MFFTRTVHNCVADISVMEDICDRYLMDGTVENIFLCQASSEAVQAAVRYGFSDRELKAAAADDLLISVDTRDLRTAESVLSQISSMASADTVLDPLYTIKNPDMAFESDPEINWAMISLPPHLAYRAAVQCMERGAGVILTQGLQAEKEAALKKTAVELGVPLLGGGVQGAVIAGRSVGICPEFSEGKVSVLGQSLIANMMLAFLLEERGIGIRSLISSGRRDCFAEESAAATLMCLDALAADEGTDSICLVLKSGDLNVIADVVRKARECGKKLFLYEVGMLRNMDYEGKEDAPTSLAALADDVASWYGTARAEEDSQDLENITTLHRLKLSASQKYLRGFFMSETMCGETASLMMPFLKTIYSNSPVKSVLLNSDTRFLKEHSVIDCAHSSFAPSARSAMLSTVKRNHRMISEAYNRTVAVILADWYGGLGCTGEQLEDLAECIRKSIKTAEDDGRHIAVGVIITSGEGSPVSRRTAAETLRQAGADVFYSADEAAEYVRMIIADQEES